MENTVRELSECGAMRTWGHIIGTRTLLCIKLAIEDMQFVVGLIVVIVYQAIVLALLAHFVTNSLLHMVYMSVGESPNLPRSYSASILRQG